MLPASPSLQGTHAIVFHLGMPCVRPGHGQLQVGLNALMLLIADLSLVSNEPNFPRWARVLHKGPWTPKAVLERARRRYHYLVKAYLTEQTNKQTYATSKAKDSFQIIRIQGFKGTSDQSKQTHSTASNTTTGTSLFNLVDYNTKILTGPGH